MLIFFIATATSLLSIDLSKDWTNSTVTIQTIPKDPGVPILNSPSVWYHESTREIYTGYTGYSPSFDLGPPPPLSLWTFKLDDTGNGIWNQVFNANASQWPSKARPALSYMAYDNSSAYILSGLGNLSISVTAPLLGGMIQFNMDTKTFSNNSNALGPSDVPAYGGSLHYVPVYGSGGLHVAMGGNDARSGVAAIDFGTVLVYDPVGSVWYNQSTTGYKPAPRKHFCTAGSASSNQTYEMLVKELPCQRLRKIRLPIFILC